MWNRSKKCPIRLAAGILICLTLGTFLSRFEYHLSRSSITKSTLSTYGLGYDNKSTFKGRAAHTISGSAYLQASYLKDNSFPLEFNDFCVVNVNSRLNCTITLQQAGDIETGVLMLKRMLHCIRYNILISTGFNATLDSPNDKNVCGVSETNSRIFYNLNLNKTREAIDEKYPSRVPRIYIDKEFWGNISIEGLYDNVIGLRLTVSRSTNSTDSSNEYIPYHVPAFYKFSMAPSACNRLRFSKLSGAIMTPCNDSAKNLRETLMSEPSKYYLNHFASSTPQHVALYVIRNAVVVSEFGRVFTAKYAFETSQCKTGQETDFVNIYSSRQNLTHLTEVFVTTQLFSVAVFHYMAEAGARIAPYLEFLKQYPNIKIHAPRNSIVKNMFTIYGLDASRIVSNAVWADIVYLPQGGGCGGRFSCIPCLQIAYEHFRHFQYQRTLKIQAALDKLTSTPECSGTRSEMTFESVKYESELEINRKPLPNNQGKTEELGGSVMNTKLDSTAHFDLKLAAVRSVNRPVIDVTSESNLNAGETVNHLVLIKRTGNRALTNHCQVESYLKILAQEFGLVYILFPDKPLPDLNTTLEIYRHALVVVAPHGAGLTNLVFTPHGAFVVEVLERKRIGLSYHIIGYLPAWTPLARADEFDIHVESYR